MPSTIGIIASGFLLGDITDSFDRADNASSLGTSDTGQAWTNNVGVMGISSNLAYPVTAVSSEVLATLDAARTEMLVRATVTGTASVFLGIVGRYVDANNFYLAQTGPSFGQLFRKVGGTFTQLGSNVTRLSEGDVIGLRCSGSSIQLTQNGSAVVSVTDVSLTSGTRAGFRFGSNTPSAGRYNNFAVVAP